MKIYHLFLVSMVALGSGCSFFEGFNSGYEENPPQPDPKTKKNGPPDHAPAHGYRKKFKYKYYPSKQVYYRPETKEYYWLDAGDWKVGVKLPDWLTLDTGEAVALDLDSAVPYSQHAKIKKQHPGKRRGPKKPKKPHPRGKR